MRVIHVLPRRTKASVSQGTDIMCLKKNKRGNGHVYLISKAKHVMALDQSFSAKEVCILLAINERTTNTICINASKFFKSVPKSHPFLQIGRRYCRTEPLLKMTFLGEAYSLSSPWKWVRFSGVARLTPDPPLKMYIKIFDSFSSWPSIVCSGEELPKIQKKGEEGRFSTWFLWSLGL